MWQPKDIHVKFHKAEYLTRVQRIPTRKQLENNMAYRRRIIFESSSIDDLKHFINSFRFINEDKMFIFGEKLGNGDDANHFQLMFSSKTLISKVLNGQVFHIDGTYKIIKYFYPVIVFGCSDVNRKFYPIAYAITSHKQNEDYVWFFTKLNEVCQTLLNFEFKPKYLICHASKAIGGAIETCYPDATLLMCWFHMKANIKNNITKDEKQGPYLKDVPEHQNTD